MKSGLPGNDVRTKYERAMEALITRANKANMTRAAFELERDQLLKRAKEEASALSGVQKAGGGEVKRTVGGQRRIETGKPVEPKKSPVERVVPVGGRGGL
jgi:hypothetical protein